MGERHLPPCTRGSWGGTCARRRCRVREQQPLLNSTAHPRGPIKETGRGGGGGQEQDGLPETAATLCHSIGSVGATILIFGWCPRLASAPSLRFFLVAVVVGSSVLFLGRHQLVTTVHDGWA